MILQSSPLCFSNYSDIYFLFTCSVELSALWALRAEGIYEVLRAKRGLQPAELRQSSAPTSSAPELLWHHSQRTGRTGWKRFQRKQSAKARHKRVWLTGRLDSESWRDLRSPRDQSGMEGGNWESCWRGLRSWQPQALVSAKSSMLEFWEDAPGSIMHPGKPVCDITEGCLRQSRSWFSVRPRSCCPQTLRCCLVLACLERWTSPRPD